MVAKPGGRIRFAGGPLHNQVLYVNEFRQRYAVAVADQQEALKDGHMDQTPWWHVYRLQELEAESGARWLEYQHERPAPS